MTDASKVSKGGKAAAPGVDPSRALNLAQGMNSDSLHIPGLTREKYLETGDYVFRSAMGAGSQRFMLDVNGGRPGTNVHLWQDNAGNQYEGNQIITVERCYDGSYRLKAAVSGCRLGVKDAKTENCAELVAMDDVETVTSTLEDRWAVHLADDGSCVIQDCRSERVIDISGARMANGSRAIIYDYHGKANQRFFLTPVRS